MKIYVPNELPTKELLDSEGVNNISWEPAPSSALHMLIVNLMPVKPDTEADLLRMLAYSPTDVEVTLAVPDGTVSRHTPQEHIDRFYIPLSQAMEQRWDGMIVTGAPLDYVEYEDVRYWHQIQQLMEWNRENVRSTMWVCWGAFAVLYNRYGIDKHELDSKLSGVFSHTILHPEHPLMQGMQGEIRVPHSRHVAPRVKEILKAPELSILAYSPEAGAYLIGEKHSRDVLILGHPEYDAMTLHKEYVRDLGKGINPHLPDHYYPDGNPELTPVSHWKSHAQQLYYNWILNLVAPQED